MSNSQHSEQAAAMEELNVADFDSNDEVQIRAISAPLIRMLKIQLNEKVAAHLGSNELQPAEQSLFKAEVLDQIVQWAMKKRRRQSRRYMSLILRRKKKDKKEESSSDSSSSDTKHPTINEHNCGQGELKTGN